MAAEYHLPLEIIQKIQHYLGEKRAAQSVVLSKSWYKAWSTQPILYLNDKRSPHFLNFAREKVKRYKQLKLYVNELVITLINNHGPLADHLIMDALNLSAKELALTIKYKGFFPLYVLPAQLFVASCLTKLHVHNCEIKNNKVLFPRLKSLSLDEVSVADEILRDVLLGCPLLENLFLKPCDEKLTVNVSKLRNLVNLSVILAFGMIVEFDHPEYGLGVAEFPYLRTLELGMARLSEELFTRFSSRFPCVEKLYLESICDCEDVKISSRSLRYLRLTLAMGTKNIMLDVPNIVKFYLRGSYDIPFVSFGDTAPKDWISDVQLVIGPDIDDSWVMKLRLLLTGLSSSTISLNIKLCGKHDVFTERTPCFPIPMVEYLSNKDSLTSPSAGPSLLWGCGSNVLTKCLPIKTQCFVGKGLTCYVIHCRF